ncbi:MAG: hypothetical protein ABI411_09925 [Tahibacter sp.]
MKTFGLYVLCGFFLVAGVRSKATELTLDSRDFVPTDTPSQWAESSGGSLICTGGVGVFAAQLDLPANSTLTQIAVWGGDSSTSRDSSVFLRRVCQAEFLATSPTFSNLAQVGSSGSAGAYFDSAVLNEQAFSTNTCTYSVVLSFGDSPCSTNLSVAKVRVRYTNDAIFAHGFE